MNDTAGTTSAREKGPAARLARFASQCEGATAVEYGLIAAAIVVVILVPLSFLTDQQNATYQTIMDYFSAIN